VSGGNLLLAPHNGNNLVLLTGSDWTNHQLGSSGITLAPGVLTPGTLYYIYVYNNAGTLTLESSTTAYAVETTHGFTVKTGDSTRLLVGMAVPIAGPLFGDTAGTRYVRTWFNDPGVTAKGRYAADKTQTSATFTEIDAGALVNILTWAGETIIMTHQGPFTHTSAGAFNETAIGIDSTTVSSYSQRFQIAVNDRFNCISYTHSDNTIAEGAHTYHHLTQTDGATLTVKGGTLAVGAFTQDIHATGRK